VQAHVINPGDEGMWVDAAEADLMLSDVTHELLAADIAPALGVAHLAPVCADVTWPVRACLFGAFSRVMASVVVTAPPRTLEAAARSVNVVFVVDTGSPYTFLAQSTLQALGYGDTPPRHVPLCVHGVGMTVQASHSRFADANVLGTDFLVRARCMLTLDFSGCEGLLDVPKMAA
jgi:hypothetical protein